MGKIFILLAILLSFFFSLVFFYFRGTLRVLVATESSLASKLSVKMGIGYSEVTVTTKQLQLPLQLCCNEVLLHYTEGGGLRLLHLGFPHKWCYWNGFQSSPFLITAPSSRSKGRQQLAQCEKEQNNRLILHLQDQAEYSKGIWSLSSGCVQEHAGQQVWLRLCKTWHMAAFCASNFVPGNWEQHSECTGQEFKF